VRKSSGKNRGFEEIRETRCAQNGVAGRHAGSPSINAGGDKKGTPVARGVAEEHEREPGRDCGTIGIEARAREQVTCLAASTSRALPCSADSSRQPLSSALRLHCAFAASFCQRATT
jgi:hypothetical protein